MSAWHHISPGSCAFGSLPKPRGRLEAHGSAFLDIWTLHIDTYHGIERFRSLYGHNVHNIFCSHFMYMYHNRIYKYTYVYIYIIYVWWYDMHISWPHHSISNSQCIAGSGSGQGSCSLCSGTWSAGVTWEHIGIPELVMKGNFGGGIYWFLIYTFFFLFARIFGHQTCGTESVMEFMMVWR